MSENPNQDEYFDMKVHNAALVLALSTGCKLKIREAMQMVGFDEEKLSIMKLPKEGKISFSWGYRLKKDSGWMSAKNILF